MATSRADAYREKIALQQQMMSGDAHVADPELVSEPKGDDMASEPMDALNKLSEAISSVDVEGNEDEVSGVQESVEDRSSVEVEEDDGRVVEQVDSEEVAEVELRSKGRSKSIARKMRSNDARPAQIRDFPRSLLDMCKAHFPGATATEALAAYVLMKSGEISGDISETIVALAKSGDDGDMLQSLDDRVRHIEGKLDNIVCLLEANLLASTFTAFDLAGFRQEAAKSPREINYLENGMDDALERLKSQAKLQHTRERAAEGRPKKGAGKRS